MSLIRPTHQFPARSCAGNSLRKYIICRTPILFERITAESTLKATEDEYESLRLALHEFGDSGFEIDFDGEEVFIFAPTAPVDFERDKLPSRSFLSRLGALIAKNGPEFLEFAVAWWIDDPSEPRGGGATHFRVMRDGSVRFPKLSWPSEDQTRETGDE